MKNWYLVAYDIRDEKRLKRIANIMEGYGRRIQYSVFRCYLSKRDLERLHWELARYLSKEDSLMTIEICRACVKRIRARGEHEWPEDLPNVAIL